MLACSAVQSELLKYSQPTIRRHQDDSPSSERRSSSSSPSHLLPHSLLLHLEFCPPRASPQSASFPFPASLTHPMEFPIRAQLTGTCKPRCYKRGWEVRGPAQVTVKGRPPHSRMFEVISISLASRKYEKTERKEEKSRFPPPTPLSPLLLQGYRACLTDEAQIPATRQRHASPCVNGRRYCCSCQMKITSML